MPVLKFTEATPVPQTYQVAAEKLVHGNPTQTLWLHYTDASGRFMAGVWHSEVGCWRIRYTEEEYCEILEGTSILTADSGEVVTVSAGERFVIPAGFVGTWEVREPTRKNFVIYEATTGS